MKALVYMGPEALSFREMPDPSPTDGEVLIKVDSVGICGSDMHAYLGHDDRRPAPLILGHEAAGTIVGGARDGERVTINPLVTCGVCPACRAGADNLCPDRQIISMPPREGAMAEWLTMPENNLVTVPDSLSLEKASLAEPIACGWHAARLACDALRARPFLDGVLVIGGGAIGVGAALSLIAQGFEDVVIVETNEKRRAFVAETCGLATLPPDAVGEDRKPGLVVDAVGLVATRAFASKHVAPGGVILHIGLGSAAEGLDIRRMTLQEVTFIGTYTYTMADFRTTAAAMFDGRLGSLDWADSRPLSDGADAFAGIRAGAVGAPKIILKPFA
ncbi:MAG: alcohol dehydrogenase catalytic domain-containing protein [Alphaproteobacteria bacterium]|nr:alcohol dehydrogenase catalytic domain-containing protein [Alphaproteobacteria bacterium]